MLELRPNCEHCDIDLPPSSPDAMICSFECTFCRPCVDDVLFGVCPNCGGGFSPRPIRPTADWKGGNNLAGHPASTRRVHRPLDPDVHREFAAPIIETAPADR